MKKILILLGCATLLCSCEPIDPIVEKCTKVPCQTIYEFEYEGHQYIKFDDYGNIAIVHNPDCSCHE